MLILILDIKSIKSFLFLQKFQKRDIFKIKYITISIARNVDIVSKEYTF